MGGREGKTAHPIPTWKFLSFSHTSSLERLERLSGSTADSSLFCLFQAGHGTKGGPKWLAQTEGFGVCNTPPKTWTNRYCTTMVLLFLFFFLKKKRISSFRYIDSCFFCCWEVYMMNFFWGQVTHPPWKHCFARVFVTSWDLPKLDIASPGNGKSAGGFGHLDTGGSRRLSNKSPAFPW